MELTNVLLIELSENPRDYRAHSYYNNSLLVLQTISSAEIKRDFPILGNRTNLPFAAVAAAAAAAAVAVHRPAIASRSCSRALNRLCVYMYIMHRL